ncbi:MAG: hypothetical protein ACQKBV_02015, partial [Puniceicoccales bacterium]
MNISAARLSLAFAAMALLVGCPDSDEARKSRQPGYQAEVIRQHYIDREDAVKASMSERLAYKVVSARDQFAALSEPEQAERLAILNEQLGRTDSAYEPLAAALAVIEAGPALDTEVRVSALQQLSLELEKTRGELDAETALDSPDRARLLTQLLVISIALGKEKYALDYERAVIDLQEELDEAGRFGEIRGGLANAGTLNFFLTQAAYVSASTGDDRLRSHPYYAFAPYWFMHHLQPGERAYLTHGVSQDSAWIQELVGGNIDALATLYPSPESQWVLNRLTVGDASEVELPEGVSPPPPFGIYPQAALVFWRSSWEATSDTLLARGAVENDPESELDAGQVTWFDGGVPVLIEAEEDAALRDESGREVRIPAHNVLRVDDAVPMASGRAPILTRELSPGGGNLRIDASELFPELSQWRRDLFWETGGELRIIDNVSYALGHRERTEIFWHLNADEPVEISKDGGRTIVEWDKSAVVIQSNATMEIVQHLIDSGNGPHVVLVLRTIARPASFRVLTRVLPRESGLV